MNLKEMAKNPITITVKVGIGRHSQSGCPKFGLCSVTISGTVNEQLSYYDELNTMDIQLSRSQIQKEQPDKLVYFEGKNSVTFEEDYTFPPDIQEALKSDHPLTVPAGTDTLITDGDNYIIKNVRLK